jgi:hypothetical protein
MGRRFYGFNNRFRTTKNTDLLNTFFNHQHEMTRSSSVNKTTMKNILNDGRDISIAKLVENTSLIIK